jgi:hypothetical protein
MKENTENRFKGAVSFSQNLLQHSSAVSLAISTLNTVLTTANTVVSASAAAVTGVTSFAYGTCKGAVNMTTHAASSAVHFGVTTATSIASTTIHTVKPYLPVYVQEKGDVLYETALKFKDAPMETAKETLPEMVYNNVEWGIETSQQVAHAVSNRVKDGKEYMNEWKEYGYQQVNQTSDFAVKKLSGILSWALK